MIINLHFSVCPLSLWSVCWHFAPIIRLVTCHPTYVWKLVTEAGDYKAHERAVLYLAICTFIFAIYLCWHLAGILGQFWHLAGILGQFWHLAGILGQFLFTRH